MNKTLESKILKKVGSFLKENTTNLKYKKFIAKVTHEYWEDSEFNCILRYWEIFWVVLTMPSKINLNEDSNIFFDLWRLMNYKVNKNTDFQNPSKELFQEVKNHWVKTLLNIISGETYEAKNEQTEATMSPLSPRNNTYKAFVLPQNHGKLVASILKRRTWWKILKNRTEYDFIWTPLIKNGKINLMTCLELINQLPEHQPDLK